MTSKRGNDRADELRAEGTELDLDAYFAKERTDTARATHRRQQKSSHYTSIDFSLVRDTLRNGIKLLKERLRAIKRPSPMQSASPVDLPFDLIAIVLLSLLLVIAGIYFKP